MRKLRESAMIIGEGVTEFYYFQSLRDVYKQVVFKPDCPKHTSIEELKIKIREAVEKGYTYVFCIIDMDNKDKEPERTRYKKLKEEFAKPINQPKKGIFCNVVFFETHYFGYTPRPYEKQDSLIEDLNKYVEYEKTIDFFRKSKGLHGYFERNGGNFKNAIANADKSMKEKENNNRDYTYTELGRLMKILDDLQK